MEEIGKIVGLKGKCITHNRYQVEKFVENRKKIKKLKDGFLRYIHMMMQRKIIFLS